MRQALDGRLPLLAAPALALTTTLVLAAVTDQTGPVLLWGGLTTLVSAAPSAAPATLIHPVVWTCAALVTVLVVAASASIGLFYSPVVLALPLSRYFAAAARADRCRDTAEGAPHSVCGTPPGRTGTG